MEDSFKKHSQLILEKQRERQRNFEELKTISHQLDAVVNFKVNSIVKTQFDSICKDSHSTISRELKLYMLQIIKQGKI